jgi:Uma2 family endonuclease
MTVDEFIDWATAQPSGRYELLDGKVYAMSPERVGHTTRQGPLTWRELDRGTRRARAGLPRPMPTGSPSRSTLPTSYEPDVLVRCGEPLDPEAVQVVDPVIVVEVNSRSSRGLDAGIQARGLFQPAEHRPLSA